MVLSTGGPGARHRTRLMASTRQIGNGSPVPPPMRHPVFACSIRSCGARSSIPDGGYVRDWVPELAQPPAGVIHPAMDRDAARTPPALAWNSATAIRSRSWITGRDAGALEPMRRYAVR